MDGNRRYGRRCVMKNHVMQNEGITNSVLLPHHMTNAATHTNINESNHNNNDNNNGSSNSNNCNNDNINKDDSDNWRENYSTNKSISL